MAKQAKEEVAEKSSSSSIKIIIFIVGGVLLICLGIGIGFLISSLGKLDDDELAGIVIPSEKEEEKEEAADTEEVEGEESVDKSKEILERSEVFDTKYYEFPGTFTSNLFESRKFVQVGIAVGTQYDEEVIMNVEKHELAIRSRVITILGDRSEKNMLGIENKEKLAEDLKNGINDLLEEKAGFGGVEHIYFTSFVIQ